MADILSLAMKFTADASSVAKNLTPAERALEKLGKEAATVTKVFDEFAGTSAAAASAQASAAASLSELTASLQRGDIDAKQFADSYGELTDSINKEAKAFKRAAEITEANRSPVERYEAAIQELDEQLRAGRISQDTYNRTAEKTKKDLDKVSDSAKKTDKSMESLTKNVSILAKIELGRLFVDGIQAIANVFRDVATRVISLVSSVNTGIDSLNDLSARTGIQVEALQGYALAAKLAGVDTEQFGATVQKLGVNIGKANPGDSFDKSLRGINLSVAELRALSPEEQFSAIGAAISQLPTAADRAAAAVEIFGKQGAALAPLFREGAASIEELQARAERLGIIISDTQVNNVADMNDAFDLVAATVQGITGQVLGNLAPAVTAVTDQFLEFVETFNGTGGDGGTGIANAITDVLLKGAEYFAGIFDAFTANLGPIGESFTFAAEVFEVGGKLLLSVSEGLRSVFNFIQVGIDGLLIGFGKLLEAVGSYISDDLEQFGSGLAEASKQSAARNEAEMKAAAENAANAFNSIFAGGTAPSAAAKGAAGKFLDELKANIENARLPEVQVQTNLERVKEDLEGVLGSATGQTSEFLQQSLGTLETFQGMAEAGGLTADQIEIMNGFMKQLNGELVKEKQNREDAKNAALAQADAAKKAVDDLLKTTDAAGKIREQLDLARIEAGRLALIIADPKATDEQVKAAEQRAALLQDQVVKLEDNLQAAAQGFEKGFEESFAKTAEGIAALVLKAEEFGPAGAKAAQSLEDGIARAQSRASAGILTGPAYEVEIKRQQDLFNKEIKNIEEAAQQRLKNEELVNGLITAQRFGGDNERVKAAQNVLAIEQEIQFTQQAIADAREAGLQDEVNAAAKRLADLDQVKAKEEDIASGAAKQRELYQKAFEKQQQDAGKAQQEQQQKAQQEQQKLFEEQRKAAEAEAKRQEERLRKLNTLGSQTIAGTDVRTQEGAALVLNLAASAQDPAAIQARLQTKLLEKIALGIGQAASNYFNQPVAIVGYSSFGEQR
jgi:hypothetical protein